MSVADEKMIENMRAESKQRRHTAIEKKIPWLDKLQLRHHVDNHKFSKTWAFRNYDHAEAVTNSLEMDHIFFQQFIFMEDTTDFAKRLIRIGYEELTEYPKQELVNSFSRVMYNKKFNIAINLYDPKYTTTIHTAREIVDNSFVEGATALAVFLAAIDVLIKQ